MFAFTEFSLFVAQVFASSSDDDSSGEWAIALLLAGFIFYSIMYVRYRNTDKRHHHELQTRANKVNVQGGERKVKHLKDLRNSQMRGANETAVHGARVGIEKTTLDKLTDGVKGSFGS